MKEHVIIYRTIPSDKYFNYYMKDISEKKYDMKKEINRNMFMNLL